MSWIFGAIGNYSQSELQAFKSIHHKAPIYVFESDSTYIAAGGLKETCLSNLSYEIQKRRDEIWIVCGLGIKRESGKYSFMSSSDWDEILSHDTPEFWELNGHYIVIKCKNNHVKCFADALGIRTMYFTQMNGFTAFSTRPDWIAKLRKDCKINLEEFSSHWLLVNQISNGSVLTNTVKLGPGGSAVCTPESIKVIDKPWLPEIEDSHGEDISSLLGELTLFPMNAQYNMSLALSGGMDSRVLLSYLISSEHKNWNLFTFGPSNHPDVRIAKRIAADIAADHLLLNDPIPEPSEFLKLLKEYVGQRMVGSPASMLLHTRHYASLYKPNNLIIDGGFGEIARRQFLNRLLMRGKEALLNGVVGEIYNNLFSYQADIFNSETMNSMKKSVESHITTLWEGMPEIRKYGVENWLELLAIRTRLPNYYGPEQSRVDSDIMNYMPFAQPLFLKSVFGAPVSDRKNGKLFKRIIRNNAGNLRNYSLVKENVIYPYRLQMIPGWGWRKLKERFGYKFTDPAPVRFIESFSEFIKDTVHSSSVKDFELYDYPKILNMVNRFYSGDKSLAGEIDWWLACEVWRQSVYEA